jgi:hypothetical protein
VSDASHVAGPATTHSPAAAPPTTRPGLSQAPLAAEGGPIRHDRMSVAQLLSLQGLAGNRAVRALLTDPAGTHRKARQDEHIAPSAALQRQQGGGQPKPDQRVSDLEKRTAALEKKQDATTIDAEYRGTVGQRLSAYRSSIYRLTGAFQAAVNGFQSAQAKQAQTNAIVNQIVMTIVSVGAAGLAEPFLAGALGVLGTRLGVAEAGIPKMVEALENPLNALTAGAASTGATAVGVGQGNAGGTPSGGGTVASGAGGGTQAGADPMSFLTANLEAVEGHTQKFEGAFAARAANQSKLSPDEWAKFNAGNQRAAYDKMIADFDKAAPANPEVLKASAALAIIIERFLWAAWIKANTVEKGFSLQNFGTDIEDRLNAIGVSTQAGVYLSGHWYKPNSFWNTVPGKLSAWADSYKESLTG